MYDEARFFVADQKKPENLRSDDQTTLESCGRGDPLRGCYGAVAAEI